MSLPGWRHVYTGKVRELYVPAHVEDPADALVVLMVASDRVSAFDHPLEPTIPTKGRMLTALSNWWFARLDVPNHLLGDEDAVGLDIPEVPAIIADRAMVARALDMHPIECVVRGYITGSGWEEYRASGTVCGVQLPAGLRNGDKLPEPIYTPARKAAMGEHDENITFDESVEMLGRKVAHELREISLRIYQEAAETAHSRGLILADTKFEFGTDRATGSLRLADEVLTSDSSRYWDARAYENSTDPQARMASFDKQIVRDWLAAHWDKTGEPPVLPDEIVRSTAARYRELLERLTA